MIALALVERDGHDTDYMSRLAPAGRVVNPHKDCISQNEIEDYRAEHIIAGCKAPLRAMPKRAGWWRPEASHGRGGQAGTAAPGGAGYRSAHGRASSKAAAARKMSTSELIRPTSCSPTGRPSRVKPAGIEAAGCPVRLKG